MRSWMIAYLAGVLLFHLWGDIIPMPFLISAFGFSVLLFIISKHMSWFIIFIVAITWSSLYSDINKHKVINEKFESIDLKATGYVCSIPNNKGSFIGFELCNTSIHIKGSPEHYADGLRLKLNWYTKEPVKLRGVNTFIVRLKKPHGMVNPSGFLYEKWLFRKGIHGVGYVKTIENITADGSNYFCNLYRPLCHLTALRVKINTQLSAYANYFTHTAIIKALSIGYKGDIPKHTWLLFKNTGTQHLIAISGLHIGLVYGAVYLFFTLIFKLLKLVLSARLYTPIQRHKIILCIVLSLIAAFFYSALAGFAVSTQRALLMILVFVICRLWRLGLSANMRLLIAAVIILIIDPNSVLDYGFWLSFLAVWTLFLVASSQVNGLSSHRKSFLSSWFIGLTSAVKMQWVICVGLCPVLLLSGMGVSYTSMAANFVAIPLVSLFTVPLVFISLVLAPISTEVSTFFLFLADTSLNVLFKYLTLFERYSGISLNQPSLDVMLALTLVMLFILLFPIWRSFKVWAVLLVCLLLAFKLKPPSTAHTELIVLDVGQGLSVVAIKGVRAVVYDTGPEYKHGNAAERSLIPFLQARGVKEIEMLVLSHGDNDHAGGLTSIQSQFSINKVISGEPQRIKSNIDAALCANDHKIETEWYKAHFFFMVESTEEESVSRGLSKTKASSNNHSCVLKLQLDDFSVLLMGDLEGKVEKEFVRRSGHKLKADILVAGHHGSKNATGYRLLNAVDPSVVVFSAGYKSRFNHPHPHTVKRALSQGATLFNTASDGAIIITPGHTMNPESENTSDHQNGIENNSPNNDSNNKKWTIKKQRDVDDAFWMF